MKIRLIILLLISFSGSLLASQQTVRIRLLTDIRPGYIFLRVSSGQYILDCHDGRPLPVNSSETVLIARYGDKLAVKPSGGNGFFADSVIFRGSAINSTFTLRGTRDVPAYRKYSGTLECFPDLGSILLLNTTGIDDYIAGVVRTEGGSGRSSEYFKTQALIARTYTYKHLERHSHDRFNLCDDTHCQAYHGLTGDSIILSAVRGTEGQVITTQDSVLIIAAFHSNCGGETAPSEHVWIAPHPYLARVVDPYCISSRNSSWRKSIHRDQWAEMLISHGYRGDSSGIGQFAFRQRSRMQNYTTGSFSIPFRVIRDDLGLRSAWFSVTADGDSLLLGGKGYGHGVGLCQEGAMAMAETGKKFRDIIMFYYPGVRILDVNDVRKEVNNITGVGLKSSN